MKRRPRYPKIVGVCASEKRGMAAKLTDLGPTAELRYVVEAFEDRRLRLRSATKLTHVALGDFDRVCMGFQLGRPTWARGR